MEEGGCAASSYIPDPLSHPLPPPPLPPPPGQAARAPALRTAAASTRQAPASGCTRRRAPLGPGNQAAPNAATPGFPCAAPPRSHGLASTCWRPQSQAEPLSSPGEAPCRRGWERRPVPVSTPRFAPGRRGGRRAKATQPFAFAKCKSATAARQLGGRDPPPVTPAPPAERGDGVRPPPARLRWKPGLLAGAGRDAADSGRGPQGLGQVAGGDGWVCVPSRRVQEGDGKLPSQLQLLSVQSNSATLRAPRPSPAPPGRGLRYAWGPRRRPRGGQTGVRASGGAGTAAAQRGRLGGAPPRAPGLETTRGPRPGPRAAHAPRGPHPAGLGARKGAEDGGAMETVPGG